MSEQKQQCWCAHCEAERLKALPIVDRIFGRSFIVCPDCGNKRCPKATCHGHQCSGHNSPGQAGSEYGTETCAADHARPINYRAHAEALAEALVKLQETCEYWIGAVDTRGMSESEYNAWLALGHHSKSMEMTRQALAAFDQDRGKA